VHHRSDDVTSLRQNAIKRFRLCEIPWITIEERTAILIALLPLEFIEPSQQHARRQFIRNKRATIIIAANFACQFVVTRHQLPEEVTSCNMHQSQKRSETRCLRALP
jgi:hypothetical protein